MKISDIATALYAPADTDRYHQQFQALSSAIQGAAVSAAIHPLDYMEMLDDLKEAALVAFLMAPTLFTTPSEPGAPATLAN